MFCSCQMCHIVTFLAAFKVACLTFIYLAFYWHFIVSLASVFDSMKYLHIIIAKQPTQKYEKKLRSQLKIIFFVFKALCSKTDFWYFSEKEVASLFKNGHFKNVQFRKIATQVYSTVFMWAIIYGNLYCRNIVHAKKQCAMATWPTGYRLWKNWQ